MSWPWPFGRRSRRSGEINAVNLSENILPTRDRATLILKKGPKQVVELVRLRKL